MVVNEKKGLAFNIVALSMVGIVTGLFLGGKLLPSKPAYEVYDERIKTTISKTLFGHEHDSIRQHEHTITTVLTTTETTPHGFFHDFASAITSTQVDTAPTTARASNEVIVRSKFFHPQTITVPIGTTVTWIGLDYEDHSVTSPDGLFDAFLGFSSSFSYTFTKQGIFFYYCVPHGEMTGTVVVK